MSKIQESELAKLIINHPAIDDIRTRIQLRLFNKFRTASSEGREIINTILDNENLFFKELYVIASEEKEIDPE